ncbi:MAG: hypothetical protein ACRD1W_15690, partial [Vicinamibacterales bacterium]
MLLKRLAFVALLVIALGAPVPRPVALAQSQNPCTAALAAEPASAMRAPLARARKNGRFGADTRDIRDLLHRHSAATSMGTARAARAGARPAADRDDNNIAILEDNNGDLIIRANPFDLRDTGLRFEPAGSGYAVAAAGAEFRGSLGRALTLSDDDSVAQTIAAPFEFYGRRFTSLFVNSDGNLTFEGPDNASTERGLQRLASGTPRIAPFFADLDPSAGGRVFFDTAADATTVTWCAVPGFDMSETMTVQAVLFSNGAIEFRFGSTDLTDGIVAVS